MRKLDGSPQRFQLGKAPPNAPLFQTAESISFHHGLECSRDYLYRMMCYMLHKLASFAGACEIVSVTSSIDVITDGLFFIQVQLQFHPLITYANPIVEALHRRHWSLLHYVFNLYPNAIHERFDGDCITPLEYALQNRLPDGQVEWLLKHDAMPCMSLQEFEYYSFSRRTLITKCWRRRICRNTLAMLVVAKRQPAHRDVLNLMVKMIWSQRGRYRADANPWAGCKGWESVMMQ